MYTYLLPDNVSSVFAYPKCCFPQAITFIGLGATPDMASWFKDGLEKEQLFPVSPNRMNEMQALQGMPFFKWITLHMRCWLGESPTTTKTATKKPTDATSTGEEKSADDKEDEPRGGDKPKVETAGGNKAEVDTVQARSCDVESVKKYMKMKKYKNYGDIPLYGLLTKKQLEEEEGGISIANALRALQNILRKLASTKPQTRVDGIKVIMRGKLSEVIPDSWGRAFTTPGEEETVPLIPDDSTSTSVTSTGEEKSADDKEDKPKGGDEGRTTPTQVAAPNSQTANLMFKVSVICYLVQTTTSIDENPP